MLCDPCDVVQCYLAGTSSITLQRIHEAGNNCHLSQWWHFRQHGQLHMWFTECCFSFYSSFASFSFPFFITLLRVIMQHVTVTNYRYVCHLSTLYLHSMLYWQNVQCQSHMGVHISSPASLSLLWDWEPVGAFNRITSKKSPSFYMTPFSTRLMNLTALLSQSRDYSCYVSTPVLGPPPFWLQKHDDLRVNDFAHCP